MREHSALLTPTFRSPFADLLNGFLAEKRASGYKYETAAKYLEDIDRFLLREGAPSGELPHECSKRWLAKRPEEHPNTQANRVIIMRQFAQYLRRNGGAAYIPHARYASRNSGSFVPRIFTFEEIRSLLDTIDHLKFFPRGYSPLRHIVMPELFRVLYGCGLRVSEALKLRGKDVNLDDGILEIHDTKFGKHRLVPMSSAITQRLIRYRERIGHCEGNAYFFPSRDRGQYHPATIRDLFRQILSTSGIAYEGRSHGPRVHDLRHTYAVHRLIQWYREGAVLPAKIPILATYLGHRNVVSTQVYLHFVPELFPEVTKGIESSVGHVIPRRDNDETD
jgi:integrase